MLESLAPQFYHAEIDLKIVLVMSGPPMVSTALMESEMCWNQN